MGERREGGDGDWRKAIGYDFIDTDLLIQRQAGMTLGDYLFKHGYQSLRQLEAEVIQGLNSASSVIATGGSAVYSDEAMYHLKASGYVVYLQCALDVLDGRIASMSDRGIAAPSGQTLADVQAERIRCPETTSHEARDSMVAG